MRRGNLRFMLWFAHLPNTLKLHDTRRVSGITEWGSFSQNTAKHNGRMTQTKAGFYNWCLHCLLIFEVYWLMVVVFGSHRGTMYLSLHCSCVCLWRRAVFESFRWSFVAWRQQLWVNQLAMKTVPQLCSTFSIDPSLVWQNEIVLYVWYTLVVKNVKMFLDIEKLT